jgi:hypothetical protein
MVEMEELKAVRKCVELKIAILETTKEREHILQCKLVDPKKFQEGRRVHINAWLDVIESYLQAGNIAPTL